MADVFEQNLPSKANLTTNDYIRVVGSDNNSYKQLVSDVAKKIIENYTGSSLAGSSQSVKSALDTLNSNLNGIKVVTLRKTVTLPAGTVSSPSSTDVVFDEAPAYFQAVIAYLNAFQLPYVGLNGAMTWVSNVQNKTITIKNSASVWEGYTMFVVGFCK